MPRLPDFQALGDSPPPRPATGIAAYDPSLRHSGEGLIAAGQDMQQASAIVAETNQRQDAIAAEAALNKLQAQRLELQAGANGFARVKGQGAVGQQFLDDYQQKFDQAASSIEGGLTSDNQRRLFQQRVPVAGLQYRAALLSHQATETDHFNEQTENDTIDLARRQIFLTPGDPNAVGAGVTQINWAIDQKAKRLGWSPQVTADTKLKYVQEVANDAAALQVERDPLGSLQALNKRLGIGQDASLTGNPAFDAAGPEKLVALHKHAEAYVKVAANQALAQQQRQLKDAEDAYNGLRDFAISGQMPDQQYSLQVLAKVSGTPFERAARALLDAALKGAMHGTQPLPVQQQNLRQLDAASRTQGTSPEQAKIVAQMRTITDTQTQAYKENPWAAATRFGGQASMPEQPVTDATQAAQIVAQRLPFMNGVETYAGVPVSPLQPGEAKAWADKLKALPPDQRAEALGQTGAMLSVPRAMALADQLDKHDKPLALALKMGLDRTTGGRAASALVLRGAQALEDKTVKKDDQALAGWRAEIAGLVRGALGDDRLESDVIDGAYYVRAAQDQEGIGGPNFTRGIGTGAPAAIAMVLGEPFTRQGVKSFLPRGMKEGDFDNKLEQYTPDRLREIAPTGQLYVRGQPVSVTQVAARIRSYGLRYAGRGKYVPSVNNAPMTLDQQGTTPLVLEVQ